jgi:hypothetical protein
MSKGGFWTPYRRGVAITLLGHGSALALVVGLLLLLTRQADFPFWLLLPPMVVAALLSPWIDAEWPSRGGLASCPVCRKPVFEVGGRDSLGFFRTRFWPERDCSECGTDLQSAGRRGGVG